ncbi:pyridoxamine 5'-phosphate oxidase family protein [Marinomonas posidonica]|uniref:Pyridoxamine 5'-phosphate oxidase-related FMN-binding protein n=1 Tax=Marinomonas posidonica (strain CECT 7376 / NCIMB 14433 / IVIA-Po-181) TaxID=491952 RepID=F6CUN0_MARPP|nr:pyridoxamine 5'-phosphate oxidase family protein [Marinomonas posidonica]AEF54140.1 pyridoxamine 5'-phosphate oxidase-related FMN-binding protein [Marinomonas posidonica IVIA-Po-181]
MLTEEVKQSIKESVLCWLATSDEKGEPNCSPKEVFTYSDNDELVIADIASPNSVANLKVNPHVCVSFIHVFKQKGFKIKGRARYFTPQCKEYPSLFSLVEPVVGRTFPVKGIILVSVTSCSPIIAPAYYLVSGTTEESQIDSAKQTYGV